MTVYVGKTNWWWRDSPNAPSACQAKAAARLDGAAAAGKVLNDGSIIICVGSGAAWIVAPETTQVSEPWGNVTACGCIDNSPAGASVHSDITSENFPCLYNQLISCGFNPTDWFVPCSQLLQNPGYVCRSNWDSFSTIYWSSRESNATNAFIVFYSNGFAYSCSKASSYCVRAFRCVTY